MVPQAADREPDRKIGKQLMTKLIDSLSVGVPARSPRRSTARLDHLRGSALGFRNLTNYSAKSCSRREALMAATTPPIVKSLFLYLLIPSSVAFGESSYFCRTAVNGHGATITGTEKESY